MNHAHCQWIRTSLQVVAVALVLLAPFAKSSGALAATSTATLAATPVAAASSTLRVLVRLDLRAAAKRLPLADLMRDVRAIWKPYALIVFADTAEPPVNGYHDEIQLVISDREGVQQGASALGWMLFVAPGQPTSFVTVSLAGARNLLARSSWMGRPFAQLPLKLSQPILTRAISWSAAHEIGHYLLRTSRHSGSGLMRGRLTAAEIMWNERRFVQLQPQEIEVLRRRTTETGLLTHLLLESPADEP